MDIYYTLQSITMCMCEECSPPEQTTSRRSYLKKTAGTAVGLTTASGVAGASNRQGGDDVGQKDDPGELWLDMWRHESVSDDNWEIALDGAEAFAEWMTEYMEYPTSVWELGTLSESLPTESRSGWAEYIEENCDFTDNEKTYSMVVIGDDDHLLGRNIGQWLEDDNEWPGGGGYVNGSHVWDFYTPGSDNRLYNIVAHEVFHSLMDRGGDTEHGQGDWSLDGTTDWGTAKPTVMATGYVYGGPYSNDPPNEGEGCNYEWEQQSLGITPEPCVTDCSVVTLWSDLEEAALPPYEKYHYFTDFDGPDPPESTLTATERARLADASDTHRSQVFGVDRPQPSPTEAVRSERPEVSERKRLR